MPRFDELVNEHINRHDSGMSPSRKRKIGPAVAYFPNPPKPEPVTLDEAVAVRMRALRRERDWSQEEVARRAALFGAAWDRSVVANLERGPHARRLEIAELFVLLHVFRTDERAFFGDGHPPIALAPSLVVEPGGLRRILAGTAWLSEEEEAARLAEWRDRSDRPTLTERRLAGELGVEPALIRKAARRLWDRTLTEERFRRLEERARGSDDPKGERRILAGHVTRELRRELEADPTIKRAQGRSSGTDRR
jgi:transcriptional regulator with XRE-family HTH domain